MEINPLDFGRIPPSAIDLEEAVLGAVLIEKNAIYLVIDKLRPESFYKEEHQIIFSAILNLCSKNANIDILTVSNELKKNETLEECGGAYYLTQLTSHVATAGNIEDHASIIQEKYVQREIIRISHEVQKAAIDDAVDVDDLLSRATMSYINLANTAWGSDTEPSSVIIRQTRGMILDRMANKSAIDDIYTGIGKVVIPNGFCCIAARPSMGKTSFSLQICNNVAIDQDKPVLLWSLEMKSEQVMRWIISQRTQIPNESLRLGKISDEEVDIMEKEIRKIESAPLYINDKPGVNVFQIRSELIRMKQKYDLGLVIIDYLQLISGTTTKGKVKNRENEVAEISRQLQMVRKEINVPLIAISQINREAESRADKKPRLSDLRESGAIEQDMDMVAFLYRPEYYGIYDFADGSSTKGICQYIVAKYRDGALDAHDLRFKPDTVSFHSVDDKKYEPFVDF